MTEEELEEMLERVPRSHPRFVEGVLSDAEEFGCVLSSLVEPLPSRICEPLPVTWRRMPDGIRHDKVSHPRHQNPSRSRQAAPPPMRAWRTRHDSPLNCTSLPWWTTLSITAAAIWSSPKTLPHMLNSRLVVNTTDWRS